MGLNPVHTKEEARERGRRGGLASGEARRKKRDAKSTLEALLAGKTDYDGRKVTRYEALALVLMGKAMEGNLMAIKEVFDRVDGKSVAKVEASVETEIQGPVDIKLQVVGGGLHVDPDDPGKYISYDEWLERRKALPGGDA